MNLRQMPVLRRTGVQTAWRSTVHLSPRGRRVPRQHCDATVAMLNTAFLPVESTDIHGELASVDAQATAVDGSRII